MAPSIPPLIPLWGSCRPRPPQTSTSTTCRMRSCNSDYKTGLSVTGHQHFNPRLTILSPLYPQRDREGAPMSMVHRLDKHLVHFPHRALKHHNRRHMAAIPATSMAHTKCLLPHHTSIYNGLARVTRAPHRICRTNTSMVKQYRSGCRPSHPHLSHLAPRIMSRKPRLLILTMEVE